MNIVVCGLGVISSVGDNCQENFDSLVAKRCGIGDLTLFDSSVGVPVGEVKLSNSEMQERLGVAGVKRISRTALLGAIAAKEAIQDAGINASEVNIGLISSTTVGGMDLSEEFYRDFMLDSQSGSLRDVVGHDCAASTDFIAERCGISGFRTTISTACSSAANAMIMGAGLLRQGVLDYVVVGGVDSLCRFTLNGFNSLMILDKELCRPLDASRQGLNLGEGAGYIVLRREDTPSPKSYCRLSGYANSNDAFHQTASSATGNGAFMAMNEAVEMAGIAPSEIDYINLHGTGTPNNDLSELTAVRRLFGEGDVPACSSTKSYTGHTLAASGGVEAVYSVMAIEKGVKYASLRFLNQIEECEITPLLETQQSVSVRHVMSNSFGFGGNCTSLIFSAL